MSFPPTRRSKTVMLGIAGVILLVIVALSYREGQRYRRANADAAQIRQIVDSVDQLLFSLLDAETGQRGFLVTGEDRYLQPYDQAVQRIPIELATIRNLLAGRPTEAEPLARLNTLVNQKLAELRQTIELRRTQGAAPALTIVASDQGKRAMDEIRDTCAQIRRREFVNPTRRDRSRRSGRANCSSGHYSWVARTAHFLRHWI